MPLGNDEAGAARGVEEVAIEFGEQRVGVDVAAAAKGVVAAVAGEVAFAFGLPEVVQESLVQAGFSVFSFVMRRLRAAAFGALAIPARGWRTTRVPGA